MGLLGEVVAWLGDPANYSGPGSIPVRVYEHLQVSGLAVAIALLAALPAGLWIGHTRRLEFFVVSVANLGRAIPSFAILGIAFPLTFGLPGDIGFWPTLIALILLAIPPILTNSYVGVKGVDRDTVEAARGMGLSGIQVLRRLELPLAAPLIVAGLRTAAVQVVATATLGAVGGWGGLGRFIVDGFAQGDDVQLAGGAVLVAALAVATELAFGLLERATRPRTGRRGERWSPAYDAPPRTA